MTTWTEKTQQSETWTAVTRPAVGAGFAPGFAARPAFAVASPAGVYTEQTKQPETWTPS
jgi:hypothetical protein